MKLIRNKCFETNSSSCHSISICSDTSKPYATLYPNDNGVIEISPGDFGWNEETFYAPSDKLSYLIIYVRDWVHGDDQARFMKLLNEVVIEHTKAKELRFLGYSDKEWGDDGYIDHQSVESRDCDHIFESKEKIKDFLFNPESYLQTDNDNH